MSLDNVTPHHGSVSEYQASGVPYASSSHSLTDTTVAQFNFPFVTRHLTVFNSGTSAIRVGFTANGVNSVPDANYLILAPEGSTPRLEIKCVSLFVRKDEGTDPTVVSVVAGITNIPDTHFFTMTGSNGVIGIG